MKTVNAHRKARQVSKSKHEFINFGGGLDLTTPAINANPGTCRDAQNWYVDSGQGYVRTEGYERFDGRPAPHDAQYATYEVTITGSVEVGDTITGVDSSATAIVIAVVTSTTPDYLVITKVSGTFNAIEVLNVSGSPEATSLTLPVTGGASTPLLAATYLNLAADEYRDDITAITGSGSVRGVFIFDDVTFAFRDNVGSTSCDLWKSTASGWSQIVYQEEVTYTAGSGDIDEGDTLTQGGVTATIQRVMQTTDVAGIGKLIITGRAGGNFAAGAATTTGSGALTLDGAESAITMTAGGRFEVIVHNFGGQLDTKRAYGVDGANRLWEFDGTVFAPIDTGLTVDKPTHIIEHKEHIFVSFKASAQNSGLGWPYRWDTASGAGEIATGDTVTGFSQEGGDSLGSGALAIISRNKTNILYGTHGGTEPDWSLVPYRDELGGYEWSIQQIGSTLLLDDRGIASLITSERYGNFEHSTLSRLIRPWLIEKRTTLVASCKSRDLSQYRLFFGSGAALYITLDGAKVLGMMPMLFADEPACAWSSELNDGTEVIIFGGTDGIVYCMDKGTSFDGDSIEHFIIQHFTHLNSPQTDKEFYGGFLEISGTSYSTFSLAYELGYGRTTVPQPESIPHEVELSSAAWDEFTWDAFYWDGKTLVPDEFGMEGSGNNVAIIIRGDSDLDGSIKLSGALLQYRPRVDFRYSNG